MTDLILNVESFEAAFRRDGSLSRLTHRRSGREWLQPGPASSLFAVDVRGEEDRFTRRCYGHGDFAMTIR